MIFRSALLVGLGVLAAAPAVASGATISNTPTQTLYQGGDADQVAMHVYQTFDQDLNASAVFFLPNPGNTVDPTTADPTCVSRPTGASSCVARNEVKITLGAPDDFVAADSGPTVIFEGGGGKDRIFSTGPRILAYGQAGDDWLQAYTGVDTLDGGSGDDLLDPFGGFDTVSGGPDFDTVRFSGRTNTVIVTLDDVANDGEAGQNVNVKPDVERVLGGSGADQLDGNASSNTLEGGDGADTINGLAGVDVLRGDAGNDTLRSRDGAADDVGCGPGEDLALVDPADVVQPDCETVELPDDDSDGVRQPADCDDANPAIKPGATDVPGNGVDEDCSGADTPAPGGGAGGGGGVAGGGGGVPDADRDGTLPPQDCDDSNPAIRPGAVDRPGDGIDQDCSGVDAPFPSIVSVISNKWTVFRNGTLVTVLRVRKVPAGASVQVRCRGRGCPFTRKTGRVTNGASNLKGFYKGRRLKPGVVIEVRVVAAEKIGRVLRYTIRRGRIPRAQELCLPPGITRPEACD